MRGPLAGAVIEARHVCVRPNGDPLSACSPSAVLSASNHSQSLFDGHSPDWPRGVHGAEDNAAPQQELHRLKIAPMPVVLRPPRSERCHPLLGDPVSDGKGETLLFGRTSRRIAVLDGCPNDGHAKLFQLVDASLVAG